MLHRWSETPKSECNYRQKRVFIKIVTGTIQGGSVKAIEKRVRKKWVSYSLFLQFSHLMHSKVRLIVSKVALKWIMVLSYLLASDKCKDCTKIKCICFQSHITDLNEVTPWIVNQAVQTEANQCNNLSKVATKIVYFFFKREKGRQPN